MTSRAVLVALALCAAGAASGCTRKPTAAEGAPIEAGPAASARAESTPPASSAPGASPASNDARPKDRTMALRITISTPEKQYQLAHPIKLHVEYTNTASAPVTFREPPRTWEVAIVVMRPGSDAVERQAAFGKTFYTRQGGMERRSIEDADDVTLASGQSYGFTEDVGTRFPHLFEPGNWVIKVTDRSGAETIESNTLPLHIVIAKESLPRLLDLAEKSTGPSDPNSMSSEDVTAVTIREFAARFIAEIHPEFELQVPSPDAQTEAQNQAAVARARAWWDRHQDSPETLAKLVELNRASSGAASP
jgi:hypothetical protein